MVCRYDLVWAVLFASGRLRPYASVRNLAASRNVSNSVSDSGFSTRTIDPEPTPTGTYPASATNAFEISDPERGCPLFWGAQTVANRARSPMYFTGCNRQ